MRYTPTLFALLGSVATSYGWVLDASCNPYKDMVITSMNSAFDMARAGNDVLEAIDPYGDGTPNQAQLDLVSYLFADTMSNGEVNPSPFRTARRIHDMILAYDSNVGRPMPNPPQDLSTLRFANVVVFCNYERFTENRDCDGNEAKGMACDTAMRQPFQMGDLYSECKNKPFGGGGTEAWTKYFDSRRIGKASIIQLCPWYLQQVKGQKFKTFEDLGNKPFPARKLKDRLLGNTAMDLVNTFSGTLLHELSHAPADIGARDGDGDDSYRWKNCRRLAKQGTTNAESYAFFGLGARMIASQDNPQRPMEDGSIQVLPAGAKKRRSDNVLVNRADAPEVTKTVDHGPVTLEPSDAASLTDVVPAGESSAVIYDVHTVFLDPGEDDSSSGSFGSSTSDTSEPTSTASTSGRPGSTSDTSQSTFITSPRVPESPGVSDSTSSDPTSSSPLIGTTSAGSTLSGPASSGPLASSTSAGSTSSDSISSDSASSSSTSSDSTSADSTSSSTVIGTTSSDSTSSGPTSSGPLVTSTSAGSTSSDSTSGSTSDSTSDSLSSTSSGSAPSVVITTSEGNPITSTVVAESTPAPTSITSAPESSDVTTVTSGSSTTTVPITVVDVTKSDTTTPVTYTSTRTSAEDGKPTDVWVCTGSLCDSDSDSDSDSGSGSGCKIPAFCNSPDLGTSWGLCCGFAPAPLPDGTVPPPGGPPAPPPAPPGGPPGGPPGEEGSPSNSNDNQSQSTTQTSSSTSESSSTTSSTSSEPMAAATITGDQFLEAAPVTSWYEVQQSLLSELMADTTDPYITWTPSSSSSGSLSSPTSKPQITSSSAPSTSPPTSAETTSSTTDTTSASSTTDSSDCSVISQGDMRILSCPSTTSTSTSSTSTSSPSSSSGCSVSFQGDMGVLSCPSTTSSSTTSTSSASSVVLSGSPTSSGTPTTSSSSSSSASPTPSEDPGTADCKIIFKDDLASKKDWMYKVTMSGDWVDEKVVKTEISTCSNEGGQPSAWVWEDQGDGFYMAGFDLYDLSDEDCVASAIRSASSFNVKELTCNDYIGEDSDLAMELTDQSSS